MTPSAASSSSPLTERFAGLHRLIGNTPLLAIDVIFRGEPRVIFAKQESLNLTGSIKDRMALFIVEEAYRSGALRPGMRIAEATSGNTGISFAAVGRALGHPVTIFMPDWMSAERMSIIASFGAEIVPVSAAQGGFLGSIRMADEFARDFLIAPEDWDEFVADGIFEEATVDRFAKRQGIAAGIVVGRLQREKHLSYQTRLNSKKVRLKWADD